MKKETAIYVACGVLFVILVVLLVFEMQNPEGGVKLIAHLLGN